MRRPSTWGLTALGVSALAIAGITTAWATGLGMQAQSLSAGTTTVARCDQDGVLGALTSAYSPSMGQFVVGTVTVSGIDAACAGQRLQLTLTDTAGAALGSGEVPALPDPIDPSAAVPVNVIGTPEALQVKAIAVVIVGQ